MSSARIWSQNTAYEQETPSGGKGGVSGLQSLIHFSTVALFFANVFRDLCASGGLFAVYFFFIFCSTFLLFYQFLGLLGFSAAHVFYVIGTLQIFTDDDDDDSGDYYYYNYYYYYYTKSPLVV